jgi:hypothetical protein
MTFWEVVVGIADQADNPSSPLSRFLAEHLPRLNTIAEAWVAELPTTSAGHDADLGLTREERQTVGHALEWRIGLDLASTPPRQPELSYLPIEQCRTLLTAAGFDHTPVGVLPASDTADPVLLHWTRTSYPLAVDGAQEMAISTCVDLAGFRQPMYRWGSRKTVDERRMWFAEIVDDDSVGKDPRQLDAVLSCWRRYLDRGRRLLLGLGERVVVAPELAGGFGLLDLVIGRTVVDVKLASAPTVEEVMVWLRQLLGYVVLDRLGVFPVEVVAVYCGRQGQLLTYPLPTLLAAASVGPPAELATLREKFGLAQCALLDRYTRWRIREQYGLE